MRQYKTMDGNQAAAYISYALSEMAFIYPITPSSPMAEHVDNWSTKQKKNIFGHPLEVVEMQSEAGAAGALHGAVQAGGLGTTFTSSQGLLLMIPNLYEMVGERLPAVFQVASRTVATSALSIFGDHSDVMAVRQTGVGMLVESSVQEVMDLSAIAHMVALDCRLPMMNFFDGFQTSHEMQKVAVIREEELKSIYPYESLEKFKASSLNNENPVVMGTAQNPDIHFQQREVINPVYDDVEERVQFYMDKINALRGTNYRAVDYYGDPQATEVIIAMGSVCQTIKNTVDELNRQGRHVGMINLRLYRPFPAKALMAALPESVQHIAVLDRTKEAGSQGEPLLLDVQSALYNHPQRPVIIGGRYGIASKEVTPDQIVAVFDELTKENRKERFTIGIVDDQTNLSLETKGLLDLTPKSTFQAKLWGFGSDGTVGASKSALKVIGDNTDKFVQGFFTYDSKKSGGLTISHLRVSDDVIDSAYLIREADYVACHNASYLRLYDMLSDLKEGGIFLLNTAWDEEQTLRLLPKKVKKAIADKNATFYIINAMDLARKMGLGRHINTMMITAFFELSNFFTQDEYMTLIKDDIQMAYGHKGQDIVDQNIAAVEAVLPSLVQVNYPKDEWQAIEIDNKQEKTGNDYVDNIAMPMLAQEGDQLTVKDLVDNGMDNGAMPLGTAAYEKRGIALEVPQWNPERCTQCNECAFICPHAAIRPFVADEEEMQDAPEQFITTTMRGEDGLQYRIQVSLEDCTGCGLCVDACPAKGKALELKPYAERQEEARNWAFAMTLKQKTFDGRKTSIKSSQFHKPLVEFSGACSGCGETSYIKLLTQLYGDRLMIANATGCSSIWGASAPTTPYTTLENGMGPTWSNSLLEDNAEFGFGMFKASHYRRQFIAEKAFQLLEEKAFSHEVQALVQDWIDHYTESEGTKQRAAKLVAALEEENSEAAHELLQYKKDFIKPTQWIIGGDGWAYDIGFGGLDHVLASGADVNMLVLDNEVYSNTGGQTSKATPASAITKFSASGKYAAKKDLGMMAMTYGNVYVAQISANANPTQMIKAIEEAEAYPGPSLIIGFVPCIAHGLTGGLSNARKESIDAVNSGYWSLYRYNPLLKEKGKTPMTLDFKRPDFSTLHDYLMTQNRFRSLQKVNPAVASLLYEKTEEQAKERFFNYARLAGQEEKLRERLG